MFEHVQPGQKVEDKAFEINAMKDVAAWFKGVRGFVANSGPIVPPTQIRIRNNSFTELDRYSVLMISGVDSTFGSLAETDVIGGIVFGAFHPGQGNYDPLKHIVAVIQQPLKAGALGTAIVHGLTPARIAPNTGSSKPYARVELTGTAARFVGDTSLQETKIIQPAPNAGGIGVVYLTNSKTINQAPITGLRQTGPNDELLQYTTDGTTWTTFANLSSFLPPPP